MFLTEPEVYELLSAYSIAVPRHKVFWKDEIPSWDIFPAVLKVVSREVFHKSDSGGVIFIEKKENFVDAIFTLRSRFPEVDRFIVEEKLHGIEAFVGVKRDFSFLHVVGIGTGGIFVEVFGDVCFIPLKSEREEVRACLRKLKLYSLIKGFRGFKGNESLLLDFLEKLKVLLLENPQIYELDLNPTFITESYVIPADGRAVLKEPEERKEFRSLPENLFRPETIAVIGASSNPKKVGYALIRNLERFRGKVFPVNPKYNEVLGFKCYPSVKDIPEKVDCALIAIPAPAVPDVLKECGEKGVKLAVVVSAGFGEAGREELEQEVVRTARKFGIRVLGPNTLGFMVPSLNLNASFSTTLPPPGEISFLSQSGALITAVVDAAAKEDIGFSEVISLGNQSDIEVAECFELAVRNSDTKVILSYVEGLELGWELLNFVGKKPAVFIKAGRSEGGKRAVASHTGSLAGNYKVFKDAVECRGGIVVDSLEEAFDCCRFLTAYGRLEDKKLLIVTNAGGPGTLAADYATSFGLELVSVDPVLEELSRVLPPNWSRINPVDLIGDATSDRYRAAFEILEKLNWDVCLVIVTPQSMTDVPEIAHEVVKLSERSKRAVVGCFMGGSSVAKGVEILKREKIPVYPDPYRAVNSIRRGVWSVQSSSEERREKA